eukprot:TRINITY_DN2562_c0_g1_i1.p1 TRINITY_DN2562_c0_g1~~TRINITY_DN2562_c0_g1_i1.p1  ORF type:complete len:117 (-),score=14.37 TRINITY_DN2562_c0_g1_i1:16-366(-)
MFIRDRAYVGAFHDRRGQTVQAQIDRFVIQHDLRHDGFGVGRVVLGTHHHERGSTAAAQKQDRTTNDARTPVSYTHLTLPTIYSVEILVGAVSLKKKNLESIYREHVCQSILMKHI